MLITVQQCRLSSIMCSMCEETHTRSASGFHEHFLCFFLVNGAAAKCFKHPQPCCI